MKSFRCADDRNNAIAALAEVFREHGFEGASLSLLSAATGLGKGSLYNFFPGGKEEMMAAVLADVDGWFATSIFAPLRATQDPAAAVTAMFAGIEDYFRAGQRVCLVGLVGLSASRDPFAAQLRDYFSAWVASLAQCLHATGIAGPDATALAEDAVAGIQGAIVLSRALGDEATFIRIVRGHQSRLLAAVRQRP